MKKLTWVFALLASAAPASAQILPPDRATTWAPGIPGGVPFRTQICATVQPSGNIQAAIDACPAGQVVQLAPGTWNLTSSITIQNGITLRGSGPSATILKGPGASANGPTIIIGTQWYPQDTQSTNLAADAAKGQSTIFLASNPGITVGEIVFIDQLYDTALTKWGYSNCQNDTDDCRGWYKRKNRPLGQVVEVTGISGNVLTIATPLHIAYKTAKTAQVWRVALNQGGSQIPVTKLAGIEDLAVVGGDPTAQGNIWVHAADSWVRNVESSNSYGSSISLTGAYRCTVRDSYFHSTAHPEPGGAGYSIDINTYSSDNLIENNISWNFNKVIVMRASGGGNVIGYNYFEDGWIDYDTTWMETGANAAHSTTSHYELFEGNEAFNFDSDNTWGNSIYITALRNHLTGQRRSIAPLKLTDTGNVRAVGVMEGHWWYTFLGNVLGNPGTKLTAAQMWELGYNPEAWNNPPDPKVLSTLLRGGNFDYASNSVQWQEIPQQAIPASLYLTGKPAFFGSLPWPWVDPTGSVKLATLPARARFDGQPVPLPSPTPTPSPSPTPSPTPTPGPTPTPTPQPTPTPVPSPTPTPTPSPCPTPAPVTSSTSCTVTNPDAHTLKSTCVTTVKH